MKKFEDSLMISDEISFYGLFNLIFLDGAMNSFAFGEALLFYKENIVDIKKRINQN